MCGVTSLIPHGVSQVFISLIASIGSMILISNCQPYLSGSDDALAQFCQGSITFALAVGILEKASTSFHDDLYGGLLIGCTVFNLIAAVIFFTLDFVLEIYPAKTEKVLHWLSTRLRSYNSCFPSVFS